MAATPEHVKQGDYYGPHFNLVGKPVRIPIPKIAQDKVAAQRLWEEASQLTGTTLIN